MMARTPKPRKTNQPVEASQPWQARHENDAGGPLADNSSNLPDRSTRDQSPANPVTTSLTDPLPDDGPVPNMSPAPVADSDEDHIRRRAYEIWERGGRRDGEHEEHWRQAHDEHSQSKRQDTDE